MGKVLANQKAYSVADAAVWLSSKLGGYVTEMDVLRCMADGDLGVYWNVQDELLSRASPDERSPAELRDAERASVAIKSGLFRIEMRSNPTARTWIKKIVLGEFYSPQAAGGTVLIDDDGIAWRTVYEAFFPCDIDNGEDPTVYLYTSRFPGEHEIVVAAEELERFESRFQRGVPVDPDSNSVLTKRRRAPSRNQLRNDASSAAEADALSASGRERMTMLKQIAALALLLTAKSNRYRKGEGLPNANQIAAAVGEMMEGYQDVNSHGLSSASLRENISEGMRLLKK